MRDEILRVLDNGGRNIRLEQAEFTDMDPIRKDTGFNVAVQGVRMVSNGMVSWLDQKCGLH